MELFASGLNAWSQLDFTRSDSCLLNDAHDFPQFKCVLRGEVIEQVQASLSHTTVRCNGEERTAGHRPRHELALHEQNPEAFPILAQASNGSVATLDQSGAVSQFNCLHDLLVAYDTGFAALTPAGDVYTWGDERYSACLGREISEEAPADKPGLVTALQDLPTGPISKIAAGGYLLAALTTGNDLYLWGGHPGRKTVPADVSDEPAPVVIEEQDIADVAVGEAHLIVLTTGASVYVIGHNGNGQLGLPIESTESWRHLKLDLGGSKRAVGVAAGPRNSFIVVEEG